MENWKIRKPLGQCSGTNKEFQPGEEYYAALVETDEDLQRRDYCAEYWHSEKPDVYCFWKTRLAESDRKKRRLFVDDRMLMSFFERLGRETEQEKLNFRFVVALILMRKKILKYDSSKVEKDTEIWRLRVTGENRCVDVVNPSLNEEQVEQLASQIGEILQVEL